jgi:hypothetical protein
MLWLLHPNHTRPRASQQIVEVIIYGNIIDLGTFNIGKWDFGVR